MLKIVEIHTSQVAQGEYVVLQNQGVMTVSLRGWAVCTDAYLDGDTSHLLEQMHIFRDDAVIKPYMRVVLFTGNGENGWCPTIDGKSAYCVYWGRQERIWERSGRIHVLHIAASARVAPVPQAVHQSAVPQNAALA